MSSINHARNFLAPIDPDYALRSIGKMVFEMAAEQNDISGLLDKIQDKLSSGRSIIDDKHSEIFERLKCRRAIPDIPSAPEWARPLIAVGYLKARATIATRDVAKVRDDLKGTLKVVSKLIDNLENDFLGDLLIETILAAREDSGFSRKLDEGGAAFMELAEAVYGAKPEPVGPETDDETAVMAAAAGSSSSGRGRCTACRTAGGVRRCAPISCWVIVVIIIIVIVAK